MAKSLMGKFEDRIDTGDRPPKIEESLCLVIAGRLARKGLPHEMPQVPIEVAGWWMTMQEAPEPFDNPHRVPLMVATATGGNVRVIAVWNIPCGSSWT